MPSSSTTPQAQPDAPLTAMTTRERYMAGLPARDTDEQARYDELGQCATPTLYEPHPELYSYEAAVDGDYPAVIHEAGEGCAPCGASAAFYTRLNAENDARWVQAERAADAGDSWEAFEAELARQAPAVTSAQPEADRPFDHSPEAGS
jgi:hypothetical protein